MQQERERGKELIILLISFAILLVVSVMSIAIGARAFPLQQIYGVLFEGQEGEVAHIIFQLRIPRTIAGILAGVGLGISGAIVQTILRNPLADPGILGINSGAAFAVVLAVVFFEVNLIEQSVWFALIGAMLTAALVYAVGERSAAASDAKLLLVGIAIGAVLSGITSAIALIEPAAFDKLRFWVAGSLFNPGMTSVSIIVPLILGGAGLALFLAPALNVMALGAHTATSFGVNVGQQRTLAILVLSLLAGAATALVGPIIFVGLAAPHLAKRFARTNHHQIILLSAIFGAAILLCADILGRVILRPTEVQAGIIVAFVGAPVLIGLARSISSVEKQ